MLRVSRHSRTLLNFSILAVVSAEALAAFVDLYSGLALHSVVLLALLTVYSLRATRGLPRDATGDPSMEALPAICIVPLLRILSATMAVKGIEPLYWTAFTAVPLLLGVFLTVKSLNISWPDLGVSGGDWGEQALIGLSGAGLGLVGFAVFSPQPMFVATWQQILAVSLVVVVFAAFVEEVVFRGLLQSSLERVTPRYSVLGSSILFSAAYLGSDEISFVPFITAAGFYFGLLAKRTKSVVGVSVAHALMSVGMFVVWPVLLR